MADRLLWVDGFQTTEALSSLLMCSVAFLAPFDEQSPTSVNHPVASLIPARGEACLSYTFPLYVRITTVNVK